MSEGLVYANSNHVVAPPAAQGAPLGPAATEAPKSTEPEIAAVLFPEKSSPKAALAEAVPDAIRKLRDEDGDRKLYSAQKTYAGVVKPEHLADGEGVTPEIKAAAAAELREVVADLGLSVPEASRFLAIVRQTAAEAPTEEIQTAWRNDATKQLIAKYGKEGAQATLDLIRALVARDPRVANILQQTRTGDHPDVVMAFVDLARAEKAKGRLK